MSTPIRRLVVDLLKPHEPDIVTVSQAVAELSGIDAVNAVLIETDRDVETIKLTIEGAAVDLSAVETQIEDLGGTIHSIDEVVCVEYLTEQSETPQDR